MYSREELGALADVVLEHRSARVSDEIYERLVYGDHRFASFATVRPGLAERTITVNGVSKSYAMTGWRIGWTLSPPKVATAMADLQSQETSNPSSISQYAAVAALARARRMRRPTCWPIRQAARVCRSGSSHCRAVAARDGRGILRLRQHQQYLGAIQRRQVDNSTQWCLALLAQQNVATVMGSAFGTEGYARLSFATSMANLEAGLDGIERFLKSPQ